MKYIKLLRVSHWTKNLFVFAPLFFSGQFFEMEKVWACILGFFAFSLCASSIYILNDMVDAPFDRLHQTKKHRPIASGIISRPTAIGIHILLLASALILAYSIEINFFSALLVYYFVNLLYIFRLKRVSIIDILIISIGFVIRVAAGGIITDIPVSHWLYIMTFLLSLFIALAKRRDDVLIYNNTGTEMRLSIQGYNLEFITSALSILSAILVVSYIHYVTSTEVLERFYGKHAYISAIFVILGILRYLQITLVEAKSGSPAQILMKDRFLQITILLWISFFITIIYLVK